MTDMKKVKEWLKEQDEIENAPEMLKFICIQDIKPFNKEDIIFTNEKGITLKDGLLSVAYLDSMGKIGFVEHNFGFDPRCDDDEPLIGVFMRTFNMRLTF